VHSGEGSSSCLGRFLITLGLVLVVVSAALFWLARPPASGEVVPTPTATVPGQGAPAIVIGPTAAAAATALSGPRVEPTGVPTPSRPSAPVRLVVPSLGISAPVVEVGWHLNQTTEGVLGEWDTVTGAVGFLRGSADPGSTGNCVLAGHSSNTGNSSLSELYRIPIGNLIVLYNAAGSDYTYVIEEILSVDETGATVEERRQHARLLDPTDQPVLTVVTCWPAWSYTSRIVVRARLRGPN